jgi:propionyl-CoA synthetase
MDVRVVDDEGRELTGEPGKMGNVVLAQPLPPSALTTLWRNEERFQE